MANLHFLKFQLSWYNHTTDNALFISNIFIITRNSRLLPIFANENKAYVSIKWTTRLFAMLSKELWLVQVNHATVKLDSNVKWKQNWTACQLKKSSQSLAIRTALWAEKFGRSFEYCRHCKNTLGFNESSLSDGAILCSVWLVILKSVWYIAGDTS